MLLQFLHPKAVTSFSFFSSALNVNVRRKDSHEPQSYEVEYNLMPKKLISTFIIANKNLFMTTKYRMLYTVAMLIFLYVIPIDGSKCNKN